MLSVLKWRFNLTFDIASRPSWLYKGCIMYYRDSVIVQGLNWRLVFDPDRHLKYRFLHILRCLYVTLAYITLSSGYLCISPSSF